MGKWSLSFFLSLGSFYRHCCCCRHAKTLFSLSAFLKFLTGNLRSSLRGLPTGRNLEKVAFLFPKELLLVWSFACPDRWGFWARLLQQPCSTPEIFKPQSLAFHQAAVCCFGREEAYPGCCLCDCVWEQRCSCRCLAVISPLLAMHRLATASLIHWYLCNILGISDLLVLPPPLSLTNEWV